MCLISDKFDIAAGAECFGGALCAWQAIKMTVSQAFVLALCPPNIYFVWLQPSPDYFLIRFCVFQKQNQLQNKVYQTGPNAQSLIFRGVLIKVPNSGN
jgi:hypothetical protein